MCIITVLIYLNAFSSYDVADPEFTYLSGFHDQYREIIPGYSGYIVCLKLTQL